ncbi:hypothetical protein SB861_47015 [Paraburkholderia sp. SIMBA_049]
MQGEKFELSLVRAADDAPPFSTEYQAELRQFSSQANASSQRAFAMDGVGGGGGPIGEFIFNNSTALITALSTVALGWIKVRAGRMLRLKVGDVRIEARNVKELEAMVEQARKLQEHQPNGKKKS